MYDTHISTMGCHSMPPSRRHIAPTLSPSALSLVPPTFSSPTPHLNAAPPIGATTPRAQVLEVPLDDVKFLAHVSAHFVHGSNPTPPTHPPVSPSLPPATFGERPSPTTHKTGVYRFPLSLSGLGAAPRRRQEEIEQAAAAPACSADMARASA
jgi:hypothetical protein